MLAGLALAASLIAAHPAAQVESAAGALLKELAARQAAARTITEDITFTMGAGRNGRKQQLAVKVMRPDSLFIQYSAPNEQVVAVSGTTALMYDQKSNSYQRRPRTPGLVTQAPYYTPMGVFLANEPARNARSIKSAGTQKVNGVACQIVELSYDYPTPRTLQIAIGPDKLVHRTVLRYTLNTGAITLTYDVSNVKAGAPLTDRDFVFDPPKSARPYP